MRKNFLSQNEMNFNPVLIRSHDGLVFDHITEDISYTFDRNDVYINGYEGINTYIGYCFFLKNTREYYERIYKRIQDLFSQIGGTFETIFMISNYLNYLYNYYIVLSDTEISLNASIHTEKVIHKNLLKKISKSKINNIKMEKRERKKNNAERQNISQIRNNKLDIDDKDEKDMSKTAKNLTSIMKDDGKSIELKNDNNKKINIISISKNNFCHFLLYKINSEKYNDFKYYENFRMKIMSEEHLIRNHLNIYHLLKVTEKKRHKRYDYRFSGLLKFI